MIKPNADEMREWRKKKKTGKEMRKGSDQGNKKKRAYVKQRTGSIKIEKQSK